MAQEEVYPDDTPTALRELNERQQLENPRQLYRQELVNAYRSTLIGSPRALSRDHTLGKLRLTKTNQGHFRTAFFPSNRGETYASVASLWVGAIVDRDTLVSTGMDDAGITEFWPDEFATIQRRSINPNDEYFHPDAISEQDLIATYYDTLDHPFWVGQDPIDNRSHEPIGLRIDERSMQWSYDYASDFVMFDYEITNLTKSILREVYIGVYMDGDTYFTALPDDPRFLALINPETVISGTVHDDLCGMLDTYPVDCDFIDTLTTAYILDNDGDPNPPQRWSSLYSLRHVSGIRVMRTPNVFARSQFNWWISGPPWYDFGPRRAPEDDDDFREMDGYLGTPYGDNNKYYMMSNGEHDYHQITSALNHEGEGWLAPHSRARNHAYGGQVKFLMSYGPFTIYPGQSVPFTYAYIAGENAHRKATNHRDLYQPLEPGPFLASLDFSDLALNSRWANWIYDNPGVDTDFDGYRGKSRDCVLSSEVRYDSTFSIDSTIAPPETTLVDIDTVVVPTAVESEFYAGDGVPDFVGASPPPAPLVRVLPEVGKLTLRWNGYISETTPDPFTEQLDFEGYRVYSSLSGLPGQFVLQSSYDIEDFNRYTYIEPLERFELREPPFSLAELRALYGQTFDPADYNVDNPMVTRDPTTGEETIYYFSTMDWNNDDLGAPFSIRKLFPDAPKPPSDESLWTPEMLTENGDPKFYEYEYTVENLLPSIPVYATVTAFDYGSPKVKLPSLESNPLINMKHEFPLKTSEQAQLDNDPVVVYPNPYRSDGNYRESGFEAIGRPNIIPERTREIHFINLPLVCTIYIYSLDGDLIRQVEHNRPEGGERAMHESWNVLSRNLQPVVSGIYYWIVEQPDGATQMGKLAIIM